MSDLKKVISIDLSDNTKTGLEGIDQTFKDVDNSINKAETTSGNLRLELKQLQKDLLSGKFTGEEFTKATQRAGELKDSIGDLNSRIKTLASDSRNLDTLVSAAGAMASGFAIAEGAAGLLGDENKDLQQSILKVQSSMAILQGVTALTNELQKDSTLIVGLQTLAQKAYNLVLDESTGKLNYFKLALAGTGIGIFIILLGELIANWDSVSNAISGTTNEMKLLNSVSEDVSSSLEDVYTDLYTVKSAFDQARDGAISKKDALKVYNETLGNTLGKAKTLEEAEKLYADKTGDYIKASMLRAQAQALIAKAATESAKVATGEAADIGFLDRLGNIWEGYTTGVYKSLDDVSKAKVNAANKDIDTLLNLATKAQTEADKLSKKTGLDFIPDEKAKEVKDKNEKIKPPPIVPYEDISSETETILSGLDARNQAIRDKDIKFKEDQIADEQQFQLENAQIIYDSDTGIAERREESRQRENESFRATTEAVGLIAKSGQDVLAGLEASGIARSRAGQSAMKALALVQIGADSAIAFSRMMQGSESAATGAASVAGPAAPGVYAATKIAFYASGTATILANIARAKKLLGSSGGTSVGGGTTGVGGVSAPAPQAQFNIVGQSSNNQLAQTIAGAQQQPVQAFVVAGEVSTQQALDRNKIQNSTFL